MSWRCEGCVWVRLWCHDGVNGDQLVVSQGVMSCRCSASAGCLWVRAWRAQYLLLFLAKLVLSILWASWCYCWVNLHRQTWSYVMNTIIGKLIASLRKVHAAIFNWPFFNAYKSISLISFHWAARSELRASRSPSSVKLAIRNGGHCLRVGSRHHNNTTHTHMHTTHTHVHVK